MNSPILSSLEWDRGRLDVWKSGGALHDLELHARGGDVVFPLAEAPWRGNGKKSQAPAHLSNLGGEWPCIPFGSTDFDPEHHGYGSNADWRLDHADDTRIDLHLEYPNGHIVERLRRTVKIKAGSAEVVIHLEVQVRQDCVLPIGLHPIFRLAKGTQILPGDFDNAQVFPSVFEPGVSLLKPGYIANRDGVFEDTGGNQRTPLSCPSEHREELIQLWHTDGSVCVAQPSTSVRTKLKWNPVHFPHLLIWISNKGRLSPPWNGKFMGIGLEPVNSYFDLNDLAPTSVSKPGIELKCDHPFRSRYSISLV